LLLFSSYVVFAVSTPTVAREITPTAPRVWKQAPMMEAARGRASRRPTEAELASLQDRLEYKFNKSNLLVDALTHSSFSAANNDVLHVLGTKVVQQAVALHMILQNPEVTKSELDTFVKQNSNAKDCAKDALKLGLDSLIMVGKGVETLNDKIVSAAFNAIFGAIAVDSDPNTANSAYWRVKGWNHHPSVNAI